MNANDLKKAMSCFFISVFVLLVVFAPLSSFAGEEEDLTVLRNTVVNLLQTLVDQGVMSREQAEGLIKNAQEKAAQEVAVAAKQKKEIEEDETAIRVQYVPDFVKDEIRREVRKELKEEVVKDVLAHAQNERWGVKEALPSWISKVKIGGDIRLRGEFVDFGSDNAEGIYLDYPALNERRVTANSGLEGSFPNDFLPINEDRERTRVRVRLNLDVAINDNWTTGIRVATGNDRNPVSVNQTLGNTGNRYEFDVDRAFLRYQAQNKKGQEWLTLWGGRFENPWFATDLVWDQDLSFEGIAGTLKLNFGGRNSSLGTESNNLYLTLGAFPLEEYELSSREKWLLGAQVGGEYQVTNSSRFSLGAAYYNYKNVQVTSPRDLDEFETLAPEFFQNGNSFVGVLSPFVPTDPNDQETLFGLASDYNLFNLTGRFETYAFSPYALAFTADYVKNIGYDDDILESVGLDPSSEDTGYQFRLDFGWPEISQFGSWNVYAGFKHIERDAVFAAFTDSNFNFGGTDSEGWYIGGAFGIAENTWISARWISTEELEGPPDVDCDTTDCTFDTDLLQINLEAKY